MASWLKGKGTKGIETDPNIKPAAKMAADKEDNTAAKAAVGGIVGAVAGNHEERVIEHIVSLASTGQTAFEVAKVVAATGASSSFVRFFIDPIRRVALEAKGFKIESATQNTFSVVALAGTTVAAPTAAAAAPVKTKNGTTVKAKSAAAPSPAANLAPTVTTASLDADFFYFDPLLKAKITASINNRRNHWIYGPTGCGKSEFFERLLVAMGKKFYKVNCHGESSADDILGHYTLRGGATVWVEGALVKAMLEGCPIIIEENDIAPAEVNMVLQRALESRPGFPRQFHNARNGMDVIGIDGFCVFATGNSAGGGDHAGIYTGVQTQNAAYRDRYKFDRVDYLPAPIETEVIIKRTGLGQALAEKAVELATAARIELKNGNLFTPISTRSLLEFGWGVTDLLGVGLDKPVAVTEAMKSAVLYKAASPSDEDALHGLTQRIFGVK